MRIYNDDYSQFPEPPQSVVDKFSSLFLHHKSTANKYNKPILFSPGEGHYIIYPDETPDN